MEDNMIEVIVEKSKQMFPKNNAKYSDGDWAIVSVTINEVVIGEPKVHEYFNTITLIGKMMYMDYGTEYRVIAKEVFNEKFGGYQYEICYMMSSVEGEILDEDFDMYLQAVLSSSQIDKVKMLPNPKDVLENRDIDTLTSIKGVGKKTAMDIVAKYHINKTENLHRSKLAFYGISSSFMETLKNEYGGYETAYEKMKINPYILADEVKGIGFAKADKIAEQMGLKPDSPFRMKAFITYYMNGQADEGMSFVFQEDLMGAIRENLDHPQYPLNLLTLRDVIYEMRENNELWWNESKTIMALPQVRQIEWDLAQEILRIQNCETEWLSDGWLEEVRKLEEEQGWEHTEEQLHGIETAIEENFIVVTGGAGTGKTTIVQAKNRVLVRKFRYMLGQCALSGKASQRIAEVTGYDSSTIHRLLAYNPTDGFVYNKKNPLPHDIIIIDEGSMVDAKLMLRLLSAVKDGAKVIILGDEYQLQSIGLGNVLLDLVNSKAVPHVNLTQIHRQAKKSAIVTKSVDIRFNVPIIGYGFSGVETYGELQDFTIDVSHEKEGIDLKTIEYFKQEYNKVQDIMEVQICCATRTRGDLSAFNLNNRIKQWYNPIQQGETYIKCPLDKDHAYHVTVGDKVLITKNKYKIQLLNDETGDWIKGDVFNGNLGIVLEVYDNSVEIDVQGVGIIRLTDKQFNVIELGYAITTHKFQGSQAHSVIVPLDMGGYMLLCSEWLYTAITRAKKYCVLVGQNGAIMRANTYKKGNKKTTFLYYFLQGLDII